MQTSIGTTRCRVRASLLSLAALVATSSFACAEQVYFSEINYHPKDGKPEFIEILNQSASAIDFANWRFADGVEYEFPDFNRRHPQRTFMCAFERILVSGVDEATLRAAYSIPAGVKVFGPWTGALSNGGENIRLEDKNGIPVNSIDYRDSGRKWPVSADGAGHTLVLINPNGSGSDWRNWGASAEPDGTPGSGPGGELAPGSGDFLSLSEVHFDAAGNVDWVEVSSSSSALVSAEGLSLSSSPDFADAVSLSGDVPANGYASWDVSFPTGAGGEVTLYLSGSSGIVFDAKRLTRDSAQEGFQLYPPQGEWYGGTGDTRNTANNPARNTDIIINEIMADPPSDERNGEYVELYNRGASTVDLSGWRFVDGISFEIPPGTSLGSGQFLVVAANKAYMESVYSGVNCLGDYGGRLANQGELLRLEDGNGNLADEVDYRVGGDWPTLANGDGSSLELAHPDADNDLPTSWKDSDETTKSTFQNFSFTSTYSHLPVPNLDKELWMHLVGDAHIVLKGIQLKRDGSNILQNHTRITPNGNSNGGWLAQGTHHASHFQRREFHLISDGHGDNRVNRIELQVDAMNGGDELTYEFQARWVMGKPRLIVKTFEDSFVGSFRLEIPNNLGTPGAANSILAASPPTGLGQLQHSPAVPSTADNVRISARVASAPAPTSMEIVYRQDTSGGTGTWQTTAMNDSGTGGDTIAGDGIWSGEITNQKAQARIVQFYVRSTAPGGVQSFLPARGEEWPAMYVVDNDVPDVDVTTYRYVYSAYDAGAWASGSNSNATYDYKFPHLSNSYKNMTLVVNESEVYYNCEVRPSASPWHAGSRASLNQRGKWRMPKDHRFRGLAKLSFDNTPAAEGTANIFNNKVPRQILYLMGHETSENEFATVIMNADTPRNSVEIFEPKDNDFLKRNFGPDGSQGELFRGDDVFFFDDSNNKNQITNRWWWYAGDDWPGPARYHSQWLLRSQEADYDYSALVNMLKTVRGGSDYTQEEIDRLVNAQRICMVAAVRGYIGDWDSFTLNRPKNTFFYRPPGNGKFQFLFHDSDLAFQNTGQNIINGGSEFSTWVNKPYNRRIFRYYLAEVLDKWQANGYRMNAWFDCEDSVSSTYDPNQSKYTGWDSGRNSRVLSELGANYTLGLGVDPVPDTSADSISITGDAGYRVWEVTVEGHPEASFSWTGETEWRIDGIVLQGGVNTLNITGLDVYGQPAFGGAGQIAPIIVNKTNNGAPFVGLDLDPESANVALSELLHLDASASYDPEGGGLTFAWGQPAGLAGFGDLGATATAAFATPGLYDFSVTASDPDANETTIGRGISVFGPLGFSTFGEVALDAFLETVDVEVLDNYSPGPWYSLQTDPGKLTITVPPGTPYPLGLPQDPLPRIKRDLPAETDWVLQTDLELTSIQFGEFITGLLVEVELGGQRFRYAFGYRDGAELAVTQVGPTGTVVSLFSMPYSDADNVTPRIRREDDVLFFDWQPDVRGVWENLFQFDLGEGATTLEGGIFAATEEPLGLRVSFDYLMLIDPNNTSPTAGDIVISEVMYKPLGGPQHEYIELYNAGAAPVNLNGFRFPEGSPVAEFIFGEVTLEPGAYLLVVSDESAFLAQYGAGLAPLLAGAWTDKNLSNSGEEIILLDADDMVVASFTFSDQAPWPTEPDNNGTSLVLIDPSSGNPSDGTQWRASMAVGGSPGVGDPADGLFAAWMAARGETDPLATKPGEPVSNLLTYGLGIDLASTVGEAMPIVGTTNLEGQTYLTLSHRRRLGDPSIGHNVELSHDLVEWADAAGDLVELAPPSPVGDGTELVHWRRVAPLGSAEFLRVNVTVP